MEWGGKRENSGRKLGVSKGIIRKPYSFRLTEAEHKAVKEYIKFIKLSAKNLEQ